MCVNFCCIYVSALLLPISAFSKAFDCKGEEGSKESEGKRGKAMENEETRGKVKEREGKRRSRAATNATQGGGSEGRKKGKVKSEKGRVKNLSEE